MTRDDTRRLAFAHELADEARSLSVRAFHSLQKVDFKGDGSPVTEADRGIEKLLRRRICDRFPLDGISGEEFGDLRPYAEATWFIDPIDGTKSFVCGMPAWGTMIALTRHGIPRLGLIDVPALAQRWTAVRGAPTRWRRDGRKPERCTTSRCAALGGARLCLPSPDTFTAAHTPAVRRLVERAALVRYGGDCHSYALLASGSLDVIVESGLDDHDFLPAVPIIESAGGVVTDWAGRPLGPHSDGHVIAASTQRLHADVLARLQDR